MPILKGKNKYVRIYRPAGTRYAEGSAKNFLRTRSARVEPSITAFLVESAFKLAYAKFCEEFSETPDVERMIVEMTGDSFGIKAVILELPEDKAEGST